MIILGIHGNIFSPNGTVNESSASIVKDGKLLACIAQERLSRKKVDGQFPYKAIDEALKIAGLTINEIDIVSTTSSHPAEFNTKYLKAAISTYFDTGVLLSNKIKKFFWYTLYNKLKTPNKIKFQLKKRPFDVTFQNHHFCHAASAFYPSGFEKAVVFTLDGGGDGLDGSVYLGEGTKMILRNEIPHFQSPGTMYSALTHDFGFKRHRHEGKITGLAAYGNPDIKRLSLESLLKYNPSKKRFVSKGIAKHHKALLEKSDYFSPKMEQFSKEDLAAGMQHIFETEILSWVSQTMKELKQQGKVFEKVCLAGGCFANVKLNQRIMELGFFDDMFVFPAMGDDGLSAGSALGTYYQKSGETKNKTFIENVYLGGSFDDDAIEKALNEFNLKYQKFENVETEIAKHLANNKVVARYNGRMEYGPRALGNRSVIAAPFDKSINDWLNKKFQRTEFMPFAPSITFEAAPDYLENYKDELAAEFMTITYEIKEEMASKIPAVVHVDNTARPQVVKKERNESYHKIITEFGKITGIPIVLNTSFNMHEEPIVYTPQDAIRGFLDAHLDVLAIGKYIVFYE